MHTEDANVNSERNDNDMAGGLEPRTLVIDGHVYVECPEPANALELYQHADTQEDEAGRTQFLCEGCHQKKDAKIYARLICAGCGEVSWYERVHGGTIQ